MSNYFEKKARTAKVRKIARAIRLLSAGRKSNAGLRRYAERMSPELRLQWASAAGCHAPSATTWSRVVLALGSTY